MSRLGHLNPHFRFVTNTTRLPRRLIAGELKNVGITAEPSHVFTPARAARTYIEEHDLALAGLFHACVFV